MAKVYVLLLGVISDARTEGLREFWVAEATDIKLHDVKPFIICESVEVRMEEGNIRDPR
jgi:hypothetical protein